MTNKNTSAPSDYASDQPGLPPSLIRVFTVHVIESCMISKLPIDCTANSVQGRSYIYAKTQVRTNFDKKYGMTLSQF